MRDLLLGNLVQFITFDKQEFMTSQSSRSSLFFRDLVFLINIVEKSLKYFKRHQE